MKSPSEEGWWSMPSNFNDPLVFYMEEDQEERIFGPGDTYLRCIEEHSETLIQLESFFTATGQTRVTVVGPMRARHWLRNMIWSLGSPDSEHQAQGLEMLLRVQSQPLTSQDLASFHALSRHEDTTLAARMSGPISLNVSPGHLLDCIVL